MAQGFTPISAQSPYTGVCGCCNRLDDRMHAQVGEQLKALSGLQRFQRPGEPGLDWSTSLWWGLSIYWPRLQSTSTWPVTGWAPTLTNIQGSTHLFTDDDKLKLQYCTP
ncbi:hypothetical protein BsWGS_06270 [Bradybaena similaris]